LEEYWITLPKPKRDALPSLGYTIKAMGWIILVKAIKGVLFMPKNIQWTCNITLGSITYLLKLGKVLHSPTKTYKGCNTLNGLHYKHQWAESFCSRLLKGNYSCPKKLNEHALPLPRYPKNTLGSITYLLTHIRVFHSPTKTYKETITLIRVLSN
jgi:hypothetical protein